MKQTALIILAVFALAGFSSVQACEYMNKTLTLTSKDSKQVLQTEIQAQTPAPSSKQKLTDIKKPVNNAN